MTDSTGALSTAGMRNASLSGSFRASRGSAGGGAILGSGAVRGRGDGGLAKRARVFEWGRGVLASALASGGLTEATAGVEFGEASAVGEATPAAGEAGGKIRIGVGNAATGGRAAVGSGFTSTTVTSEASIRRFSDGIETFGVPSPEVSNCSASRTM